MQEDVSVLLFAIKPILVSVLGTEVINYLNHMLWLALVANLA